MEVLLLGLICIKCVSHQLPFFGKRMALLLLRLLQWRKFICPQVLLDVKELES
jgi:hypothetical protein